MKYRSKVFVVVVFVVFLLNIFLLNEAFAEGRIVYVDLASIFDRYQKTKDYDVNLETTQKGKQDSIDKQVDEIKEMQDKLDLLSDKEKESKQEQINNKTKELQEFQRNAEIDLREVRNERLKEVLQDIQDVVEEIAKKNKYDFILNDRVLLYGNDNLDISKEVLKKLNENYKQKK